MNNADLQCQITSIKTHDHPTAAPRPLNSRMSDPELNSHGIYRPDWVKDLKVVLNELKEQQNGT